MFSQILAQSVEPSSGGPVAIVISIVAAVAAVAAVFISKQALDYAKGEPVRAVQRSLDGELRVKVTALIEDIKQAQTALQLGKNIPKEPPVLKECQTFRSKLADRRPNRNGYGRYQLTAANLQALSIDWHAAVYGQERAEKAAELLKRRREEQRTDLDYHERELTQSTRARDAWYLAVREKAQVAVESLHGEIRELDKADRGEIQG